MSVSVMWHYEEEVKKNILLNVEKAPSPYSCSSYFTLASKL